MIKLTQVKVEDCEAIKELMVEVWNDEHERWFQKTLNSKKRIQMIMEKNGVPVGQIRIDIDGKVGEIGYAIAPEYRGRGYGAIICKLMVEYARNNLRICIIILCK